MRLEAFEVLVIWFAFGAMGLALNHACYQMARTTTLPIWLLFGMGVTAYLGCMVLGVAVAWRWVNKRRGR